MAETTTPALHSDNSVALLENVQFKSVINTPLQPLVDILLPDHLIKIRLGLRIMEGIDTTVEMRESSRGSIPGYLITVSMFQCQESLFPTMMIGQLGLYFANSLAVKPLKRSAS